MKVTTLKNERKQFIDIEFKEINDTFSAFRCSFTVFINGKTTETKTEGISTTKNIKSCIDDCRLPLNMNHIIFKNDELLELVRVYGHPDTLGDKDTFGDLMPFNRMKELIENGSVKYDNVNKDTLDQLIIISHSSHSFINLMDGSLYNVARFAENIHLGETKFKNYEENIKRLVDEKRISMKNVRRGDFFQTHWGSDLRYVCAKVAFTDEEFNKIISMKNVLRDTHSSNGELYIDDFYFSKVCDELDLFGMTKDIKTEQEQEEDHRRNEENSY